MKKNFFTRSLLFEKIIATGLGVGLFPYAPGTMGSLFGILLWYIISLFLSLEIFIIAMFVLCISCTFVGTMLANRLESIWGHDPKCIVIDEIVGIWIVLFSVMIPLNNSWNEIHYVILSFCLFRFFDILKPLGISCIDRKNGGFWVMADDIVAGIYSFVIVFLIRCMVCKLISFFPLASFSL